MKNDKLLIGIIILMVVVAALFYFFNFQQTVSGGGCYLKDDTLNECVPISCDTPEVAFFSSRAKCESSLALEFVTVYRYNKDRNACDELYIHNSELTTPLEQSQQRCLDMIDPNRASIPEGEGSQGININPVTIIIIGLIIILLFRVFRKK